MFRLHRSDRLVLALILLAVAVLTLRSGIGEAAGPAGGAEAVQGAGVVEDAGVGGVAEPVIPLPPDSAGS